jgi:hypothetical protein
MIFMLCDCIFAKYNQQNIFVMNKFSLSRNLGFFTGPLLIIMGLIGINGNKLPKGLGYVFVALGCFRLGLTIYAAYMSKKNNTPTE